MPIELEGETLATTHPSVRVDAATPIPALTVLAHPNKNRVGDRLVLRALAVGQEALISRVEPVLDPAVFGLHRPAIESRPLGGLYLSRQPIRLRPGSDPGSVILDLDTSRTRVEIDGEPATGETVFSAQRLTRGIELTLGRRISLLLHLTGSAEPRDESLPSYGLIGDSDGMVGLRREIRKLAKLDVAVLLRGESGTGKELVARALHDESRRSEGPFVAVNMGALNPSLAAADLFGVERGAFTGADRSRPGHFRSAHGGTLFLDEIGEAPLEVQAMLLRILETSEVQPVGSTQGLHVDVRIVAATDSRLEEAMAKDRFKTPLYHRLGAYTIRLPALRRRLEDLGQLFFAFLAAELQELGQPSLPETDPRHPWPPTDWVARLVRHDWPGNVRELRNVARCLAIAGPDGPIPDLDLLLPASPKGEALASPDLPQRSSPTSVPVAPRPTKRRTLRKLEEVSEAELLDSLRVHRWHIQATAEALGISRPNLYRLMEACPAVRKANDLTETEIQDALASNDGELEAAAFELEVSLLGLKRRIKSLGHSGN